MGGALALLGVVSLGRTLASAGRRKGTDSWPVVPGVIVASSVQSGDRALTVNVPELNPGTGRGPRVHVPRVQYRYRVGTHDFTCDRVEQAVTTYSAEAMAVAVVSRYPVGATVRVAYDPANPASAVLEVESSGVARDLAVGALLVFVGGGLLLGSFLFG